MLISRDPLVPNDLPGKVRYPIRSTLRLTSPQTLAYVTGQLAAARIREAIFSDFVKRWQASPSLRLKAIARDWEASFLPIWSLQLEPADTLQAASPVSRADAEPEGLAAFLSFPLHQPNRFKEDRSSTLDADADFLQLVELLLLQSLVALQVEPEEGSETGVARGVAFAGLDERR